MGNRIVRNPPTTRKPRQPTQGNVEYYYNDPTTPKLSDKISPPARVKLPVQVDGYIGGGQPDGSSGAQAATTLITISNSLDYVSSQAKNPFKRWAAGGVLKVVPRAGVDLNAFYDRRNLKFFYLKDPVLKKFVFACDSVDIVAHELGHALLDIMRPDLWNVQALEVWAFHEAYGDCNAIMTMLSQDRVIDYVLDETGGDMSKNNTVSRLAEQFGLVLWNIEKNGNDKECLRNAVNKFTYSEPEKLPKDAPANQLSGECHSFSRVWTGAWYDFLVNVYNKHKQAMGPKKALQTARDVASKYLLFAIPDTPLTTRFFDAVARQMLAYDGTQGRPYRTELLNAMNGRNILSQQVTMLSLTHSSGKPRKLKLIDHMGVAAMDYNPLHYVEIEAPDDEDGIDAALECVNYLHQNHLVTNGENTPFQIVDGKLVRSHVMCGCQTNNACDPNAPEYGKGYKPQNNAGCCGKGAPRTCGCGQTTPTTRPKLGCFTSVKSGNLARYRNGYNTSRKVC